MTLAGLAVKSIRRNKLRTTLTIVGVSVAILAFVFLRTGLSAWTSAADYAAQDRLSTMNKVTFIMPLPKKYFDYFNGTRGSFEGVSKATYSNWFGARHPVRKRDFFANIAVDPDTFFDVYSDMAVPPEQLEAWRQNRRGAIIGEALANQFDWKIGDSVTLEGTIYPGDWKFEVMGIYKATGRAVDRSQFLFHWDYLNESIDESRREKIGWISTKIDDPSLSPEISETIDATFAVMELQTSTMTEKAMNNQFLGGFAGIFTAIDVVSVVILGIMMLILGNTIAMGVRERINEYGVMLAVGFRPRHIAGFVVGEAVFVSLLGGALGLLLAYPFIEYGMGRWLEENMGSFFPYFRIPTTVAILAMVISAVLAAAAAAIPAYRASRLQVVDALRRVG